MNFTPPQSYSNIIQPGETHHAAIFGNFFHLSESTYPLDIAFDGRSFVTYHVGHSAGVREGLGTFSTVQLKNNSGQPVHFRIVYGLNCNFNDHRFDQIEAMTEFVPWEGEEIAAGKEVDFDGTAKENRYRRKCVTISNLDPAVYLHVQDKNGKRGLVVRPGETITVPTSQFIRIKNPATASVQVAMHEIWWVF